MKDILFAIIALAGLGTAVWFLKMEKPKLEEKIAALETEIDGYEDELKDAKKATSKLESQLAKLDTGSGTNVEPAQAPKESATSADTSPTVASPSPDYTASAPSKDDRLNKLNAWRTASLDEIEARRKILVENQVKAKTAKIDAELALDAKKAELGLNNVIKEIGNRGEVRERQVGTRVSEADSKKILVPLEAAIAQHEDMLTAIDGGYQQLAAETKAVEERFKTERDRIFAAP